MSTTSKRTAFWWCAFGVLLYALVGVFFPFSLWATFDCTKYGSVLANGTTKTFGGVPDYARLYPHMVLYPLAWFILVVPNLLIAMYAIEEQASVSGWLHFWRGILVGFVLISGVAVLLENSNPGLMLFELSPTAQSQPVERDISHLPPDFPAEYRQQSPAQIVFQAVDIRTDETTRSSIKNKVGSDIFGSVAAWEHQSGAFSQCRPLYLLTFGGIVWTMLATFLCAFATVSIPASEISRHRRAVYGTIGAIVGLLLWFPSRMYYNHETKWQLFPSDDDNPFNFFSAYESIGLGGTEAIPLLLFVIATFFIVFVVFRNDAERLIRRIVTIFAHLSITSALIWAILNPDNFGKVVGLNGNWPRFSVVTCLLLVFCMVYLFFTVGYAEAGQGQSPNDRGSDKDNDSGDELGIAAK